MDKNLLYRYVKCQTSADEEAAIIEWIAADPTNEHELAEIQHQHDLVAMCAPTINELYLHDRRARLGKRAIRWVAATAAGLLLLFGGYHYRLVRDFSQRSEQLLTICVPAGQHIEMTLQDGTLVWLNAGTTLRYPALFDSRQRRVEIDGEARFEVAHDASHPFIVKTYAFDIKVLGTKFNITAEREAQLFSTALFEGSVEVISHLHEADRVRLSPNEIVRFNGSRLAVERLTNTDDFLWTEGIINLTGRSFPELMRRFEKAFGATIRLERTPTIHIGQGKLRQSIGIDNALQVLQQFADFEYTHDVQTNTIVIR